MSELDHVIIAAAIRQWRRRLSACVYSEILSTVSGFRHCRLLLVIFVVYIDDMNSYLYAYFCILSVLALLCSNIAKFSFCNVK